MSTVNQIPRSSIIWLLFAQLVVMLPHMPRLSLWMLAIWLLCAAWRLAMFRGQASYPGALIRVVLVLFGCLGIVIEFGSLGSLDIAVALLILAFSLKLIEVRERRDLFLVLYLAYFIVAAGFLFSQSLLLALYQLASVVFITAALVAMQQTPNQQSALRTFENSVKLLAQAVPIMLVFFVVFPRLGPLWSVPNSDASTSTGMSDNMSPGDVAKLSQSSALAFRVMFDGESPPRDQLYWRATSLSFFDGRQWTRKPQALQDQDNVEDWHSQPISSQPPRARTLVNTTREPVQYEITLEPNQQRWVFALPIAQNAASQRAYSSNPLVQTNDLSLLANEPYYERSIIRLRSQLDFTAEPYLSPYRHYQETDLPVGFNPRARQLAENWYRDAGSPQAYMRKVLAHFASQPFYYTLEPPKLGQHSVDEFLFDTRRGFCEHYASSFTFLMRAAGVPARVVIGYQGGELNPYNRSLTVRQFDAHAWAEVWFEGQGWTRVDPTAAVAPSRILMGLEAALSNRDEFMATSLLSPYRYRDVAWLSWVRHRLDAINYAWYRGFVNFDTVAQYQLLERLLGKITPARLTLAVVISLCMVLGLVALSLLRHRVAATVAPETRLYLQFCARLEKLGLQRATGEAPGDFSARVGGQYPHLASAVAGITQQYQHIAYAGASGSNAGHGSSANTEALNRLRRSIKQFKPRLKPARR